MIIINTGILTLLSILFLPQHEVLAYLDPGTGSFLIQLLIGGIVGAIVLLKAYWTKIRAFFSREKATTLDEMEESDTDADNE